MQFLMPQMKSVTTRGTIDLQSTHGGNDELIHDSDEVEEEVKPTQSSKRKITKQYLEQKKLQILEGCANTLAMAQLKESK